ncbi:MAG: uroporphyrinogen-III C-methyltransferase [Rhizobiales bacterium]|nr:uroporphyrinogen-III C-methyltransferase [Hyphomicrobiales bacterium]NRB13586.1 uroporphyrinogen-III C-methyltransferase [Hyphomicrobiales bacterium]
MLNDSDVKIFAKYMPQFPPSSVWLVGAGPGHIGLISVMGLFALKQADVIIYDALVNKQFLQFIRADAEAIYAGKRGGKPSASQDNIIDTIIKHAKRGKKVLRLKGGDPFIFGRGGEEVDALAKANIKFLAIPGITAGIGGLAFAHIPATTRETNQSITFLTGHDAKGVIPSAIDWDALAKGAQTIVMYMSLKHIHAICDRLMAGGRQANEPVAFVRNATLPDQQVWQTTLFEAADFVLANDITPPAIVVMGANVELRDRVLDYALPFYPHPADTQQPQ